ncbi:hypothetical protein [Novosphingobium lindaniclasticum]
MIFINDLSGDIDGLFAAERMELSPSVDLRAIIGSGADQREETAAGSAGKQAMYCG